MNLEDIWKEFRANIVVAVVVGATAIMETLFSFVTWIFRQLFSIFYDGKLADELAQGVVGTVSISMTAIIVGTLIGFALAYLLREIERRRVLHFAASVLLYVALAMPAYLLIYWGGTFVFPKADVWWVATGALSLNLAVFIAKIAHSGLETVPLSQIEAARAAGASGLTLVVRFEIPTVWRAVGSAIAVEWATTLKLSSLVGVIGAYDIMKVATMSAQDSYDQGVYVVVPLVYLILVTPILWWSEYLKSKSA